MIKQLSINNQILDITNILTTDTIHIIEQIDYKDRTGYRIWSNGFCEQWGLCIISVPDKNTKQLITIHKPFKDTNYCVMLSNIDFNDILFCNLFASAYIVSVNQFQIKPSTASSSDAYLWKAFGYVNL